MKRARRPQRQVHYVDPGVTPMGQPKALPVGPVTIAKMTRQMRRQLMRQMERERRRG